QLLHESSFPGDPGDRRALAVLGDQLPPELGDRPERIVVDLAPREDRDFLVEQRDQLPQDPALGLPPQTQQNEVVSRQHGVHQLRYHRLFVAQDSRKQRRAVLEQAQQVFAHFVFHGSRDPRGARPLGLLQLAERRWFESAHDRL